MAEQRKRSFFITLNIEGKNVFLEFFHESEWRTRSRMGLNYRIRVNGKWFDRIQKVRKFMPLYKFRDLFFKDISDRLNNKFDNWFF
ncbi:MAG: hypothetical protein ACTSYW_00445 [Candidatus Heimdallarchaeota archaeon]